MVLGLESKSFRPPGGGSSTGRKDTRAYMRWRRGVTPAPKASSLFALSARKYSAVFLHGFAAVTALAQALQFAFAKQFHIAAVWNYVVNVSGTHSVTLLAAFTAERLACQLSFSSAFPAIARVSVQVMPGS